MYYGCFCIETISNMNRINMDHKKITTSRKTNSTMDQNGYGKEGWPVLYNVQG